MSGFRYWEVACDGVDESGADCMETSDVEWTLEEARATARRNGWLVGLPGDPRLRFHKNSRRDLCPTHRNQDRDPRHYAGQKPSNSLDDT